MQLHRIGALALLLAAAALAGCGVKGPLYLPQKPQAAPPAATAPAGPGQPQKKDGD